jgi:hypothetical protein
VQLLVREAVEVAAVEREMLPAEASGHAVGE